MNDFFIRVKQQEEQRLPFVIYSKPHKKKLVGFFQNNDHLYFAEDYTEAGFVFAPFNGNHAILIPEHQSEKYSISIRNSIPKVQSSYDYKEDSHFKTEFESLVKKGIDAIGAGMFEKVVLSREEIIAIPQFDLVTVFEKLIQNYPDAFTYCWFHPKIGLWMGATPERLLKAKKKKFYTMALAGTKNFDPILEGVWKNKEIEEQRFVTDYILEHLKKHTSEISVSSPYTIKAGSVLHIKTDIEGIINKQSNLSQIISVLHPTPAVCGLPKASAKKFILENEGYERTYYTGFLGELNRRFGSKEKSKSDLFVNLRCMQVKDKMAHLYMGCGITKESVPEKEWIETVNKSTTMKRVIV
jgi:isochorismate synthase